jgi:hypothetical protein
MLFSPVISHEMARTLFVTAGASAILIGGTFELILHGLRAHAPADMRPSAMVFLSSCAGSLLNSVTTSVFALSAVHSIYRSGAPLSATTAAPLGLVISTGITCGYFLADCVQMIRYHSENKREMGTNGMRLMWGHHVLSLLAWPYAVLTHRCAVFVAYFLFTELTNVGQSLFHFCNKGKRGGATALLAVGGMWLLSFAAIRILTIPWFGALYWRIFFSEVSRFAQGTRLPN